MRSHLVRILIALFTIVLINVLVKTTWADEDQVVFSYCYGNQDSIFVEGRVLEVENERDVTSDDSWLVNSWRKLRQLINDERENAKIELNVNETVYQLSSGEEGFFTLEVPKPSGLSSGYHQLDAKIRGGLSTQCQLIVIPPENTLGIISDFDDTVIITDVINKQNVISNTLALNYKQRRVVEGMADWYSKLLSDNPQADYTTLFFVTGSPKQLQRGIDQFLDYQGFPRRIILTKKLNGEDSDPLLDQFKFKTEKIQHILRTFPNMKFVLVGDDGEKDPEVYHWLFEKFPQRVVSVWIRKVNPDATRLHYTEQQLFIDGTQALRSK
ncbi:MAG: DUF2183 domain-containing protein [Gammaproteobacteria bacterium]|nr:DUF2183 domain-containing protein [Gammaproteobacteria bacterium]